jgi:hypothetical protein
MGYGLIVNVEEHYIVYSFTFWPEPQKNIIDPVIGGAEKRSKGKQGKKHRHPERYEERNFSKGHG